MCVWSSTDSCSVVTMYECVCLCIDVGQKVLEVDVLLWKHYDLKTEKEEGSFLDHFQERKIC